MVPDSQLLFMMLFTAVLSLSILTIYAGLVWSMSLGKKNAGLAIKTLCMTSAATVVVGVAALLTWHLVLFVLFWAAWHLVWFCLLLCLPLIPFGGP